MKHLSREEAKKSPSVPSGLPSHIAVLVDGHVKNSIHDLPACPTRPDGPSFLPSIE